MRRETSKFTGNFRRKGFSMVEISIALVVAGIIVAGALYFVFKVGRTTELDLAKSELREKVQTALRRVELDLYSAVRVSNNMANHFPGLYRGLADGGLAGPRADVNENDIMTLFILKNKELAVPLRNVSINENMYGTDDALVGLFKVTALDAPPGTAADDPSAVLAWNAARYMRQAIQDHRFFLVSNSKNSLVLEKIGGINTPNPGGNVSVHLRLPETNTFTAADFVDLPRLSTLERVSYYLQDGNLMRKAEWQLVPAGSTASPRIETVLENVTNFQIDYLFADRRETREVDPLTIPTNTLSHPAEFQSTEPRLSWPDLSAIVGRMRVMSDKDLGNSSDDFEGDGSFELSGNRLVYNVRFTSNPVAFEAMLQNSQSLEYDNCHPNDIENSRCNPDCEDVFDSTDRNSPRWEGYGQYIGHPEGASNYCLCGQDPASGDFTLPESSAGYAAVPEWRQDLSAENKTRVFACIKEFGSCGNDWKFKDVRVRVACGCTHNTEDYFSSGTGTPLSEWNSSDLVPVGSAWSELHTVLTNLDTNYPPVSFPSNSERLKCNYWRSCGQWAESWLAGGAAWNGNPTGGDPRGGYGSYCECNTHELDDLGNVTGTPIREKDFNILCDAARCPLLYADPPGSPVQYKIYGQDVPTGTGHALNLNEAAYCECSKIGGLPPNVYGQKDFREADGFPQVPGGASPSSSGTVGSREVDVHRVGGSVVENQQCTIAQCSSLGGDVVGCCASQRLSGYALNLWNTETSGSPYNATHSGYCHDRCPNADDIWQTRRGIFGVATNAEIPSFCQNPTGGSAGNTNPMQ